MKNHFLLPCILLCGILCGCTGQDINVTVDQTNNNNTADTSGSAKAVCDHDYHRSDYAAATTDENGYEEFTCSKCGDSYREVIPALDGVSGSDSSSEENTGSTGNQLVLFDLPEYSSSSNEMISVSYYESDIVDVEGWHHKDCYTLCCGEKDKEKSYIRWELDQKYESVSGSIYLEKEPRDGRCWLVFCDEDNTPIFTTDNLNNNAASVKFEFDVSEVKFLTMYAYCQDISNPWIIVDNIYITQK
ncbi:hypothetical protein [Butyricicoccus porcorum]|uniref:Lipoprotein n=1 Tax=Butyricicoccus porcorum TaxID=1945634 RepID=A0A252F4U0_9FIRM|nr:hypothetical protein [Butyricicoccus porcorum]MCI6927031.1 hypothetical protein [Butyricicoccus porcorum]MDD6987224.1 hypothetical protein [Butyricicoccus porcorum]MDY4483477.1 hypothetical protein [Butyricicoccus porcorum]OUM20742.1 hypothetical protein CBW42_07920 [Butyricicoccus porcorum]